MVETEGAIGIRAELFNMQRRMLEELAGGADLNEVLTTLCHEVEEWWAPRSVNVSVLLVRKDRLRKGVGPRLHPELMNSIDGLKRGPNAGSCGTAAYTGEPVIVTDASTDPLWADYRDLARDFEVGGCWSFPVFDRRLDDTIATIAIYAEKGVEPTETEYKLMEGLTNVTGLIINRALMEEQLAEESMKLQHVLSGTNTGIWEWSNDLGEFEFDAQVVEILGEITESLDISDLDDIYEFVHPEDRDALERAIEEHLADATDYFEVELRFKHENNAWIWLRNRGRVMSRNPDGTVRRVLGTIQDISRQRGDEERLRRMQRLESLGRLAGGIAHDFNNIMVGIFGSISLAREEIESGSAAHEDLALAEESLERARLLTGQLLTFAKGGEPVKSDLDLGELVQGVVRFDLSGSGIMPVIDAPDDLWVVSADQGQVQQVFSNLVINAREAMENEGKLYVELENWHGELDGESGAGDFVKVKVRDTGTGIPPETMDEMFDPYFSTKEEGSGLGLATVHSILARHGGAVDVESEMGEGTTFTLYFPATSKTAADAGEEQRSMRDLEDCETFHILVLDDESAVRRTAKRMIESLGHRATCVADGTSAVECYAKAIDEGKPFDAALLDLTIPGGMGGHDAANAILSLDPEAKLVAASGYADNTILANYAANGFSGILPKPYTFDELDGVFFDVLTGDESADDSRDRSAD